MALLSLSLAAGCATRSVRRSDAASTAAAIARALADPSLAHAGLAVLVVSLERGDTLYAREPERLYTPASNRKLFTAASALHWLGPDHRFPTALVPAVSAALRERLAAMRSPIVFTSAACGADLLCIEIALELGAEVNVVLPFAKRSYGR